MPLIDWHQQLIGLFGWDEQLQGRGGGGYGGDGAGRLTVPLPLELGASRLKGATFCLYKPLLYTASLHLGQLMSR